MNFCKLKPVEVEVLSSDLQVNGKCTTILSLTGCGIDNNAASCLAVGIKHCTALEILNLSCNFIGDDGVISLADNGINSHSFNSLNLSCNKIGNRGALAIASALKLKRCRLHLWNNSFSNHQSVLAIMPKSNFDTFEVIGHGSGCNELLLFLEGTEAYKDLLELNVAGGTLALELVKCCSNLQSFSCDSILMKTINFRMIIHALQHCKDLHTLTLTNMEYEAGDVEILANFLQCASLSKLDISHGNIGKHVQLLARLECSTVCSLNIGSCDIGGVRTAAISSIHELDISSNGIRCQGAQALAGALKHCSHLTILDISYNDIGDRGACALANAIVCCTNLTRLNVCHNGIQGAGAKALVDVLEFCTQLKEIDLSKNRFTTQSTYYGHIKAAVERSLHTCIIKLAGGWFRGQ